MGSYSVILSENAYRDLKKIDRLKLPQQQVLGIFKAVKSLEDDPRPRGCKKLEGTSIPLYRIKLGRKGYRIIYQIDDALRKVDILYIRDRDRRTEACIKRVKNAWNTLILHVYIRGKRLCRFVPPYSRNTTKTSPYGQWCSKLPGSVHGSGSSFLAACG